MDSIFRTTADVDKIAPNLYYEIWGEPQIGGFTPGVMNFAFSGLANRQPVFPAHGGGGGSWGANGQGATLTINGLTIQLSIGGLKSLLGGLQSGNLSVSSLSVNDITEEGTGSEPTEEGMQQDGDKKGKEEKKEYVTPNLNGRPPTREEANLHYMYGNGEDLDVDLAKVDLSFLDPTDFDEKKGTRKAIQTLWRSDDGRVFGNITLTWQGGTTVTATYGFDRYDFEMHGWGNPKNWVRNAATIYGDPGPGTPFKINFYGEGTISPLPTWRQTAYDIINQGLKFFTPNIPGR